MIDDFFGHGDKSIVVHSCSSALERDGDRPGSGRKEVNKVTEACYLQRTFPKLQNFASRRIPGFKRLIVSRLYFM